MEQILTTKLNIPPLRSETVTRSRLIEKFNAGLDCKLTLISAPAGFGKTTLLCNCAVACGRTVAWLSLDNGDNDPVRFLTYFVAALQSIDQGVGESTLAILESPQPPPIETLLTNLINNISATFKDFILILDDYHVIEASEIDKAINFMLSHQPPQMHLVIATRTDPSLPLPGLRARGYSNEMRADELRFTPQEATAFLNEMMGLNLSTENIMELEKRTEGWIVGLQLAAL